jgi:hypothetical protein
MSLGLAPQLVEEIFAIVARLNTEENVGFLVAEQNTNIALRYADYGYILESGRVVMDGARATHRSLRMRTDVAPSPYPSLFIATPPYEVWQRSHGQAVTARATYCTNGGLQAITYLIISTGWVAHTAMASMGGKAWAIGSRRKWRWFRERGSSGPGWGNGKATEVLFAREGQRSSLLT